VENSDFSTRNGKTWVFSGEGSGDGNGSGDEKKLITAGLISDVCLGVNE
jgi:hypothetical protein